MKTVREALQTLVDYEVKEVTATNKGRYCDICGVSAPLDRDRTPLDDIQHESTCPLGNAIEALENEPDVERSSEPVEAPVEFGPDAPHCPLCYTRGHMHRKTCKYVGQGLKHHVKPKP
jgi:hypothetical protein